jgi:threonine/homoserine/homoserine lactone efflux protein
MKIVYGLTLYSAFLGGTLINPFYRFVSAVVLAGVGFCAVSTWALTGAFIQAYLNRPQVKRALNIGLSLLLVYIAVELSGILEIL